MDLDSGIVEYSRFIDDEFGIDTLIIDGGAYDTELRFYQENGVTILVVTRGDIELSAEIPPSAIQELAKYFADQTKKKDEVLRCRFCKSNNIQLIGQSNGILEMKCNMCARRYDL